MEKYLQNPTLKLTRSQLRRIAREFLGLRKLVELAAYLGLHKHELVLLAASQRYHRFYLPKRDGEERLIEHPAQPLKRVQRKINLALQAVYHSIKPDSAYGFIVNARNDSSPRNILTNAQRHLGKKWVLNLDLADFFHQIHIDQVTAMFSQKPFSFTPHAAAVLAQLTTYEGHLPMGAPSSPIISNLVCDQLDLLLGDKAYQKGWIYTRYADDITFSTDGRFKPKQMDKLRYLIRQAGFAVNERKVRLYHKGDPPEVTGLVLTEPRPDVSPAFLRYLKDDLKALKLLSRQRMLQRGIVMALPLTKLRQSIRGQINFVGMIRGWEDELYRRLIRRLQGLSSRVSF